MNPENFRVHSPSAVVFLCGGVIDRTKAAPAACLRDAFWRLISLTAPKYKIVLAEDAEPLTTDAGYGDLFSFESDIAQVVVLIVLFAESPGSLAELGAFAALSTVAPSLLAVLDDLYYNQVSFIRNGPIKFLENAHGDEWVLQLDRAYVGIAADNSIQKLDSSAFMASIVPAIEKRLSSRRAWSKFDSRNSGHSILLLTGLCQEFGALTLNELKKYFTLFDITDQRLSNFIYCAVLLGWLRRIRKGNHIFFVASPQVPALDYQIAAGTRDKLRWRSDIRDFWKVNDGPRMRAISEVISAKSLAP